MCGQEDEGSEQADRMLEEYRESLKCELEGVEEELKRLQVE
jgi:hypothetical protein